MENDFGNFQEVRSVTLLKSASTINSLQPIF